MQPDGTFTYKNELFRREFSHIKPTKFDHLVTDAEDIDEFRNAFDKAVKYPNSSKLFGCKTIMRNGAYRYFYWEVMFLGGELCIQGVLNYDVVSKSNYDAEKRKKKIEDIVSMLSHEVRQPASSITRLTAMLDVLKQHEEPEEYRKILSMLNQSVRDLDSSIQAVINHAIED